MPNKTITTIVGLLLVTGAGLLFASGRDNDSAKTSTTAPQEAQINVSITELSKNSVPSASPTTQPDESANSTAALNVGTKSGSKPKPNPEPTAPAPLVEEQPEQKHTSSSPASTVGLEGLWKLDRELTVDNATGNIIREDHFNIYISFRGAEQCLSVKGTETNLYCESDYSPFTIAANGTLTDADGFDNYRYKAGGLEAIYVQGEITKRQIFKKISAQPVP